MKLKRKFLSAICAGALLAAALPMNVSAISSSLKGTATVNIAGTGYTVVAIVGPAELYGGVAGVTNMGTGKGDVEICVTPAGRSSFSKTFSKAGTFQFGDPTYVYSKRVWTVNVRDAKLTKSRTNVKVKWDLG